jgi:hypothetical protein
MKPHLSVIGCISFFTLSIGNAGQVPGSADDPDVPISHHDRVYAAEQFSNTVSVVWKTAMSWR